MKRKFYISNFHIVKTCKVKKANIFSSSSFILQFVNIHCFTIQRKNAIRFCTLLCCVSRIWKVFCGEGWYFIYHLVNVIQKTHTKDGKQLLYSFKPILRETLYIFFDKCCVCNYFYPVENINQNKKDIKIWIIIIRFNVFFHIEFKWVYA